MAQEPSEIKIYDFLDYKEFLRRKLPTTGSQRGIRAKLAQSLGFHAAFISQVLQGEGHFSMEHSLGIGKFLDLSQDEINFFMLLVQRERAASDDLRKFYEAEIAKVLANRNPLITREFTAPTDKNLMWSTYFSTWLYAAIHTITSIPGYQTAKAIAEHFELPVEKVQYHLDFLIQFDLVTAEGPLYKMKQNNVYLEPTSPLVTSHHLNWRMKVVEALDAQQDFDMHYSLVFAVSEDDARQIKEILRQSIRDLDAKISKSKEEALFGICIDCFKV